MRAMSDNLILEMLTSMAERVDAIQRKVSEMEEQEEYRKAALQRENALTIEDYTAMICLIHIYGRQSNHRWSELLGKLDNLRIAAEIR